MDNASLLASAEAHVAQGERHVARQREIIAELQSAGHSTVLAENLLVSFEQALATHREHRDRIVAELGGAEGWPLN